MIDDARICSGVHDWRHMQTWETYDTSGIEPGAMVLDPAHISLPTIQHDQWYCTRCRKVEETTR